MLKNYLVTALRNLRRHPLYALANIGGLAVGMAGCLLLAVYVLDQLNFDRYPEHSGRLYRLYERSERGVRTSTSAALGAALKAETAQVEAVVRLLNPDNPVPLVRHGDEGFYEEDFHFADPEILSLFSLGLVEGEAATALIEPFSVVLSQSAAQRLFGAVDPMGKTLRFKEVLDLKVTGVMRDLPTTSHLRMDYLASFATVERWLGPEAMGDWRRRMFHTYALLRPGVGPEDLAAPLARIWRGQRDGEVGNWALQPLHRIHLYSQRDLGVGGGGEIAVVAVLGGAALLVVACLNYANLGTALAARRALEVGVRRALGAGQGQLARQFLFESALVVALAFAAALGLAEGLGPYAGQIIGVELALNYGRGEIAVLMGAVLAAALLLAGGYPAVFLARLGLAQTLVRAGRGGPGRRTMVVGQFLLSLGLLTATAIAYQQLRYVSAVDLGFAQQQILVAPLRDPQLRSDPGALKARLGEVPQIAATSAVALLPAGPLGRRDFRAGQAPNRGQPVAMDLLWVDADAIDALGLEVVAGQDFAADLEPRQGYYAITEQAAVALGWTTPAEAVGQRLDSGQSGGSGVASAGTIVGVVRDFHTGSQRRGLQSVALQLWPWPNYLLVRFQAGAARQAVVEVRAALAEFAPAHPFEYWFLDSRFAEMYERDRQLTQVLAVFGGLALLVACTGLFGLASFAAERRRREFGIRKVHGASVLEIVRLLGREFTLLVLVAGGLACPLAYWGMGRGWPVLLPAPTSARGSLPP